MDSQIWYLGTAGDFGSEPPAQAEPDVWDGPLTLGLTAPFWCTGLRPSGLPRDQRQDDACSLTFTSAPLTESFEILGFPTVQVYVAASEPVAQLAVKLCDVGSDGSSLLVTRGMLNLTHRHSHAEPTPLVAGGSLSGERRVEQYLARFCSRPLPPFEYGWSSLATGVAATAACSADALSITLSTPSQLILPVMPAQSPALPAPLFGRPEVPVAPAQSEAGDRSYTVEHDMLDGTVTLRLRVGSTTHLTQHKLTMSETNEKDLSMREDDPLSCTAEMRRHMEWERTDWKIVIDSKIRLSCTADMFLVQIGLTAQA